MAALPNKNYSGQCKTTEEGDQRAPGKRDLEKEMWTAVIKQ